MEHLLSNISRNLYVIPGGFFVTKLFRKFFTSPSKGENWRNFKFRGVAMKVDIAKQMGNAIYWRGAHDWAPIFVLEKFLKKGDTFIDVGANQGEYSLWAARKVGIDGRVVAFEPMQQLFDQLTENIRLNEAFHKSIIPVKLGLSDKKGEVILYSSADSNEGTNTIYNTEKFSIESGKIQLDTLDEQLKSLEITNVNFLKIDVEGAELQVLKGALNTLKKHRPIILLEINKDACIAGGYLPEDILALLKPFNYSFSKIGLRGSLSKVDELPDFCNILALPQ
ncbi:FkbM family methyltransferase [Algoriphagus sp. 4150]|uniref:FkbM family methyltransferase n=1 Tax=Algoriphagus sp. 4150 TaxID=2817756 RepID=UPI00285B7204|nr:FkbM family methyltransferase [Algoriphagus sp. 4150]MDR7130458.1 FkbM family methyltransferase [Algoriphagus sp. 4150]